MSKQGKSVTHLLSSVIGKSALDLNLHTTHTTMRLFFFEILIHLSI